MQQYVAVQAWGMWRLLRGLAVIFYILAAVIAWRLAQFILLDLQDGIPVWASFVILAEAVVTVGLVAGGVGFHAMARILEDLQRLKAKLDVSTERPV